MCKCGLEGPVNYCFAITFLHQQGKNTGGGRAFWQQFMQIPSWKQAHLPECCCGDIMNQLCERKRVGRGATASTHKLGMTTITQMFDSESVGVGELFLKTLCAFMRLSSYQRVIIKQRHVKVSKQEAEIKCTAHEYWMNESICGTCSYNVIANFWCVMQDLEVQTSVAVFATMCRWIRSRMFSCNHKNEFLRKLWDSAAM